MKKALLILALVLLVSLPGWSAAAVRTVTNCNNSGAGSLRQAVLDAGANDQIIFDITTAEAGYSTGEAGSGLVTNEAGSDHWFRIIVNSALPAISQNNIYVQGSTQTREANNTQGSKVEVRCANSGSYGGFLVTGGNCTVEGLTVNNFSATYYAGISLEGSSNTVRGCYIGTTATGGGAKANYFDICISGNDNLIDGNVISGASDSGIVMNSANYCRIKGNKIGTTADGTLGCGNTADGINLTSCNYVTIGGSTGAERNIISGNVQRGVFLTVSTSCEIKGNYIGLSSTGAALGNGNDGIGIYNFGGTVGPNSYNIVGGDTTFEGNYICDNAFSGWGGLVVYDAPTNEIRNNFIGVGLDGTSNHHNGPSNGMVIYYGNDTVIEDNIVAWHNAGGEIGIYLNYSDRCRLSGNKVGTSADGMHNCGNEYGLGVFYSSGLILGGATTGERNLISGNTIGLYLFNATSCEVKGNYIGVAADGATALPNTSHGIDLSFDCSGTNLGENNIIANNGGEGVYLESTAGNVLITRNSMQANTGKGIKLDAGANSDIPYPVISSANYSGGTTTVTGTATPNAVVEIFKTETAPGADNQGEGKTYLGSVEANGAGNWSKGVSGLNAGDKVTATASLYLSPGYTSEFALNSTVTASSRPGYVVTNCKNDGIGSLRYALASAEADGGNCDVIFDITTAEAGYSTFGSAGLVIDEGPDTWFRIIVTTSELPAINADGIAILGSTQTREANNTDGPKVQILSELYRPFNGFTLKANNCTIEGLAIGNFTSVEASAILIDNGANNNTIKKCYIGLRPVGDWSLPNYTGIRVNNGTYNVIGGYSSDDRNIISGNNAFGVHFCSASASSNEVRNNYIGLNRDGTSAVANGRCGVYLQSSGNNIIADNVISGHNNNSQSGIALYLADNNLIYGNKLGTNADGTGSLPNYYGISFEGGSEYNTVGGSTEAERNIISGNSADGIKLSCDLNTIQGNYIGLTSTGAALGNGIDGIRVANGRYNVMEGNYIGNNTYAGISFADSGASSNEVKNNFIGRSPSGGDAGNTGPGIYLTVTGPSAQDMHDQIGPGNYISNNNQYGIWASKSNYNLITQNSLEANTGKGIYLDQSNNGITTPEVWGAVRDPLSGFVTIEGVTGISSTLIEIFKTEPNPEEVRGEGLVYLGTAYPSAGQWTFIYTGEALSVGDKVCATSTYDPLGDDGYTSEFSRNRSVYPTNTVFRWEDTGPGTLRDVISHATAEAEIMFNMTTTESDSTSGLIRSGSNSWFMITINSPLTIETNSLYLHGSTQTREVSNPSRPTVEISGPVSSPKVYGIKIMSADYCTIEGLSINNFSDTNGAGIYLDQFADYSTIKGCHIGADPTGASAQANYYGIYLNYARNNLIGGASAADRNVISGNSNNGIYLSQYSGTTEVRGNYIGLGSNGYNAMRNDEDGIYIFNSSNNMIINNLISSHDNTHTGVLDAGILILASNATANLIKGNKIGIGIMGSEYSRPNGYGIWLSNCTGNIIGGTDPADRNIISGNNESGVYVYYAGTNEVRGNYIGTNTAGDTALANGNYGIKLDHSPLVTIEGNVISGQSGAGDAGIFTMTGSDRARIAGNKIGTAASGLSAIANYLGIAANALTYSTIGGTTPAERNYISGNQNDGIELSGNSDNNTVIGNYIGLSAADSALGNGVFGVHIYSSSSNIIGGDTPASRNYIGGNSAAGVFINNESNSNEVVGNYIGRSPSGGDVGNNTGVYVEYSTGGPPPPPRNSYTQIGPNNYFSYNGYGVEVNNCNYVLITRNTMEADDFKGISLSNANNNIAYPTISSAVYHGLTDRTTVIGTAAASSVIEVFKSEPIWSKLQGEGMTFLSSVETNGSGNWIATLEGISTGDRVTATASLFGSPGYTSEFAINGSVIIIPPSVEVTSPIGGEKWKGGTAHNITFTCTDETGVAPGSAALYYNDGGGYSLIQSGQATDSAYSWNPIPSVSSNTVKVKVTVMDIDGNQGTGETAGTFTIDSTPPSVTVNIPNGGEKWKGGMNNTITWTANDDFGMPANPISIEASYNSGSAYSRIATDEANDGAFSWTTPSINTNEARVKVLATDDVGNVGSDESNADYVIDITPPSITTLETPANNTTTNDATTTFVWKPATDNLSGIANYEITIDTRVVTLGAVTTYTTPDALTDAVHTWKVRAKDGAGWWGDFSTTWSVTVEAITAEASDIVLKDRATGSTVVTSDLTVTLEASGIQGSPTQMRIAQDNVFTQNDTGWVVYLNPTTYTFTAGYGTREAFYKLKNAFGTESQVHSDTIIVDQLSPTLQVLRPQPGESVSALRHRRVRGNNIYIDESMDYLIRWLAQSGAGFPPDPINLYYSLDNGLTWTTIAANLPNTGSYDWSVPKFTSSSCLISVEVATLSGTHFFAETTGNFNIESVIPAVVSITPAHGTTSVPVSTEVVVVFSDPMSAEVSQLAFSLSSAEGTYTWSADKKTMTFTPSSALAYLTTYLVNIRADAASLAGNPLPYPYASSFKTADRGDREEPHCVLQIVDRDRQSSTLKSGDYISRRPWFKGVITDNLSVDQSSIKLYLDDALVSPVVNVISPARIEVNYQVTSDLEDETVKTHTLKVEAKDTAGNSGDKQIQNLKVSYGTARIIGPVISYPQLFKPRTGVTAKLVYNLSADSEVMIYMFSTAGENPWTAKCLSGAAGGRAGYNEVPFNGYSQHTQSLLGNGNYVYKVTSGQRVLGTGYITIFD